MQHSDIHAGSGTVVHISDPTTGMVLDLTFNPGQTHRRLNVMLGNVLYEAYARLIKITDAGDADLVFTLRVPGAPSDAPPVVKNAKPHPATVLAPTERTRAADEATRSEGRKAKPHPATVPTPEGRAAKAPHSATVLAPGDHTRAAQEALRDPRVLAREDEVRRIEAEENAAIEAQEPVMSPEELADLRDTAKTRRELRAAQQGSDAPGLPILDGGDVDHAVLEQDYVASPEEISQLQEDARTLRTREEPAPAGDHPLVEEKTSKGSKKPKVTLR